MKRISLLAALLLLAACRCRQPITPQQPVEPPDTREADKAAIQAASKEWSAAAQAKDAEKFVSYYADDAVLMLEAAPDSKGRPAIHETVTGLIQDPNFALSFETTSVEVARSGDLAYEIATYTLTVTDPKTKQPVTQKGAGVTVWKKVGGQWKVAVDAPLSDPA